MPRTRTAAGHKSWPREIALLSFRARSCTCVCARICPLRFVPAYATVKSVDDVFYASAGATRLLCEGKEAGGVCASMYDGIRGCSGCSSLLTRKLTRSLMALLVAQGGFLYLAESKSAVRLRIEKKKLRAEALFIILYKFIKSVVEEYKECILKARDEASASYSKHKFRT